MRFFSRQLVFLFLLLTIAATRLALAQDATARILGQVIDPSGAVVPGVAITITNTATGVTTKVQTDSSGNYQATSLHIGTYTVEAEKSGFNPVTTPEYKLEINAAEKVNIKLSVAGAAQSVLVSVEASRVETVNSTLGQTISDRAVADLPLNGRQTLNLALLQPGVTENDNPGNTSAGNFSIAGGRSDSVTFLLDGGVNNDLLSNGVVFQPNPDAVQEFRILESNYAAEYGRSGGGVISLVTRSGSNSIHGSGFDFVRNDAFDANRFFNKLTSPVTPRDVLKRNQYGGTLGGPISVPGLFSGKDRLFFFGAYQGQRQKLTQNFGIQPVFTPAELTGDFSHSVDGGPDPDVVAFLQAHPYYQPDPTLQSQGIFNPSTIDPVAMAYIKAGLIPSSASGHLTPTGASQDNSDEFTGKVDWKASEKDSVSGTIGWQRNPTLDPFGPQGSESSFVYPTVSGNKIWFGNIAYIRTISQDLLNELRVNFQRQNHIQAVPQGAAAANTSAKLGIKITPDQMTGPPLLGFLDTGISLGYSYQGPTSEIDNTFAYTDNFTWIKGRHTMKFGAYFSPYQDNTLYDYFVNGEFYFYAQPGENPGRGNDFAHFLAGAPSEFLQFGAAPSNIRSKQTAFFAQDEFHVLPNLVFNYGLRYEYSTPKSDTKGRSFSLIPGLQSTRFVNAPNGLVFPGDKGAPKGANFPDKNDFAPRVGFAWDAFSNGKTSVRGGFGVFYDILKGEDNLQFNGQAPFFGFADITTCGASGGSGCFPLGPGPFTNFIDPYGTSGVTNTFPSKPPAKDVAFGQVGGGGVYFVDPHLRTPYTLQYNLSVQQNVGGGMVAELAYVGSGSRKLTSLVDTNPFLTSGPNAGVRVLNTINGNVDGTYGYTDTFKNIAHGSYNSLEASLRKEMTDNRLLGRSYFTLGYTWAKNMDNVSGFRQRNAAVPFSNPNQFYAPSDLDVQNRIVFSGGWDMPFDTLWSGGPKRLTSGWSLYPIATFRTGYPLDIYAGTQTSSTDPGPSGYGDGALVHVDLVSGTHVKTFDPHKNVDKSLAASPYLDKNQFAVPTSGYGNLQRNSFRGPGRTNFDVALAKNTDIVGERLKLELRLEAFNVLNHTEFQPPASGDLSLPSSSFGQIKTTYDPRILQIAGRFRF